MNNIQKSIMFTGLIIIFSSMVIFSTPINNIFAVEYDTFTSEIWGIAFQYPDDWELKYNVDKSEDYIEIINADENIEIHDINPSKNDDRYIYITIFDGIGEQDLRSFTESNLKQEVEFYKQTGDHTTDIIKNPTPIKIGNLPMGTYTLQEQDKDDNVIAQFWTILIGNRGYSIEFSTQENIFYSPETTEIRDHFIKSIKLKDQTTSPQTMSINTQALMAVDIPALKDNLMDAKETLADGDTLEALPIVTDIENQLLVLQPQPTFTSIFQNIKDSIAKADLKKAIADISKVQTEVMNAETEIINAQDLK